jgi:pimeloyl-ACP methyl ester carboxylesterase
MKQINSKTIVFLTGAFVGKEGWNDWMKFFEAKGYTCSNPPWLNKDKSPAELRSKHPYSNIADITLTGVLDNYAKIVKSQKEKPIVIGHSTGGLLAQLLLNRGLVAAAVAIHSLPPQGVIPTQWSFYRAAGPSLGIFTSTKKTYLMPFKTWQYAFTNGMTLQEQQKAYNENVVPESKKLTRQALTKAAAINFKISHAPLLFTSGTEDNIIPAALNYKNFKKYKDKNSITEYKNFEGRNHYVLGQPTWKEDAQYILNWIESR